MFWRLAEALHLDWDKFATRGSITQSLAFEARSWCISVSTAMLLNTVRSSSEIGGSTVEATQCCTIMLHGNMSEVPNDI